MLAYFLQSWFIQQSVLESLNLVILTRAINNLKNISTYSTVIKASDLAPWRIFSPRDDFFCSSFFSFSWLLYHLPAGDDGDARGYYVWLNFSYCMEMRWDEIVSGSPSWGQPQYNVFQSYIIVILVTFKLNTKGVLPM